MSHREQQDYCRSIKNRFPEKFEGLRAILDAGSLDINGNNRYLFNNQTGYLGVDLEEGPNVDIMGIFHEVTLVKCFEGTAIEEDVYPEAWDVIVSTEMLEHDMFWRETIDAMKCLLKPGGLMMFTCGGPGRGEHGTLNSSAADSPFTSRHEIEEWHNYYHNLTREDIESVLKQEDFDFYEISENPSARDIYFCGIKKAKVQPEEVSL